MHGWPQMSKCLEASPRGMWGSFTGSGKLQCIPNQLEVLDCNRLPVLLLLAVEADAVSLCKGLHHGSMPLAVLVSSMQLKGPCLPRSLRLLPRSATRCGCLETEIMPASTPTPTAAPEKQGEHEVRKAAGTSKTASMT